MQTFRTELENPVVSQDIIDLAKKINEFRNGKLHDDKFKSLRLARGIYGQRQPGVQMVRIKLPFGKVTFKQFLRIADIAEEYGSGNLHLTTRQDIQIHYVSLDRTPELWEKLSEDDVTIREACGNTVRNVTASPNAGIDADEPFDVSPYAHATFKYFLRNPICQEMGRKFKICFSSSEKDTALSFIHDVGLIPKINEAGERGFKVSVGGSLGAQPFLAITIHDFLHEDQFIPVIESLIRTFDRYGERNNRNKARLKYLIQKIGIEEFLRLAAEERTANKVQSYKIDRDAVPAPTIPALIDYAETAVEKELHYQHWLATNVVEQKQKGFFGVYIKVTVGDIKVAQAREFIAAITPYVADEIRVTANQGLLLKFVRKEALPSLYLALNKIGFTTAGFNSVADITTCPGTDTCNLGISNSMTLAEVLEDVIYADFPELIYEKNLNIKISGCMNSCGQHGVAEIGFHGSSVKADGKVVPAVQVLLGGGIVGDGVGRAAERVIKIPTKRADNVLRFLLNDFKENNIGAENFQQYYDRQGKDYFYQLLKPLGNLKNLKTEEFVDWGHKEQFQTAIGVGECAGVIIDLVATLLLEVDEKMALAKKNLDNANFADSIYHTYSSLVNAAKSLLLDKSIQCNTQIGVLKDFDANFVETGEINIDGTFMDLALQINKNEPSEAFATAYFTQANQFLNQVKEQRAVLS
ncbi:sulfite reductase (ferredoxin) [Pedobacter sp. UYP30]|uniref:nitrite reductase n=1 Tax=Pedobacter sp. UYP30 TaxID=1756400 RepID=UPI003394DDB5